MEQAEKVHRVSEFQVIERCLKIAETPMEWADEQGCLLSQSINLNVKIQIPAYTRKATCKILQPLGVNPTP